MKFGKLTAALAAGTLAVAPIAAQATVADRSAPLAGESEVGSQAGVLAAIFGVIVIAIAIGSGGDDEPAST